MSFPEFDIVSVLMAMLGVLSTALLGAVTWYLKSIVEEIRDVKTATVEQAKEFGYAIREHSLEIERLGGRIGAFEQVCKVRHGGDE